MIQVETKLNVADNSGARKIQCIKVLGGSGRKYASVGDVIVVTIKEAIPRGRVKKGAIGKAVVVRTAKDIRRADGCARPFDSTAACAVMPQGAPRGQPASARGDGRARLALVGRGIYYCCGLRRGSKLQMGALERRRRDVQVIQCAHLLACPCRQRVQQFRRLCRLDHDPAVADGRDIAHHFWQAVA